MITLWTIGMSLPSTLKTTISPALMGSSRKFVRNSRSPLWKAGSILPLQRNTKSPSVVSTVKRVASVNSQPHSQKMLHVKPEGFPSTSAKKMASEDIFLLRLGSGLEWALAGLFLSLLSLLEQELPWSWTKNSVNLEVKAAYLWPLKKSPTSTDTFHWELQTVSSG